MPRKCPISAIISDAEALLHALRRNLSLSMDMEYNISDVVHTENRQIRVSGVCVKMTSVNMLKYITIRSSHGMNNVLFNIHYFTNGTRDLHATIAHIEASAKQRLTGTETVLLIHYILNATRVQTASLQNQARIEYVHLNATRSVPLIDLRCIRGKTSDWYSDFGYFNNNKQRIALNMKIIHNTQISENGSNVSLGPLLKELWDQQDRSRFHAMYRKYSSHFFSLMYLRISSKWTKVFVPNKRC